tara:strand:+ start:393 stop:563 length:171 start_codon:yes stop_codon:yes gene_type:complete
MAIDMKENGKMIKYTDKVILQEKMVNIIMENGLKIKFMVKVHPYKLMVIYMMVNGI